MSLIKISENHEQFVEKVDFYSSFHFQDPDSEYGSGSSLAIWIRIPPDPDLQHCKESLGWVWEERDGGWVTRLIPYLSSVQDFCQFYRPLQLFWMWKALVTWSSTSKNINFADTGKFYYVLSMLWIQNILMWIRRRLSLWWGSGSDFLFDADPDSCI